MVDAINVNTRSSIFVEKAVSGCIWRASDGTLLKMGRAVELMGPKFSKVCKCPSCTCKGFEFSDRRLHWGDARRITARPLQIMCPRKLSLLYHLHGHPRSATGIKVNLPTAVDKQGTPG